MKFFSYGKAEKRGLDELIEFLNINGLNYPVAPTYSLGSPVEEIGTDFQGLAQVAYKQNAVVFACMMVRQLLFQEARFQYRRVESGRPGKYFGTKDLLPLEKPTPNTTTGDLMARAIQDVDLAGNWYGVRRNNQIHRLHPSYVFIVLGSKLVPDTPRYAPDLQIVGYVYKPPDAEMVTFLPSEVAHFAPYPDPFAAFRGMSWLTPITRDIEGDMAATTHKLKYFEQGATGNLVITFDPSIEQKKVESWIEKMEENIGGPENAYRTLYLASGAGAEMVGSNLQQAAFAEVTAEGEARIAAAAGVPPVIAGLSKGLETSTYSNYSQARRRFADGTMRPLWRNFAGSLSSIIRVPPRAELWYDDRDIPFLADDQKEAAETERIKAESIKGLTEAGFEPEAVVDAVVSGALENLSHTGMFSVQLQAPGTSKEPAEPAQEQKPEEPEEQKGRALERSLHSDKYPNGESDLRKIVDRFREVERRIRSLLADAVTGDRVELLESALSEIGSLRNEEFEGAIHTAYEAAYERAAAQLGRASVENPNAEELAASLAKKLGSSLRQVEQHAKKAFPKVNGENLVEQSNEATTGLVDEAGKRWTLGVYAAMLGHTLGRRATSRGIKDAAAGGEVRVSEHGSTDPICAPLEGKVFPALDAPEPPFHEECSHMLEPIA